MIRATMEVCGSAFAGVSTPVQAVRLVVLELLLEPID